MMSIEGFQHIVAVTLCQGNMTVAGLIMLGVVMLLILSVSRRIYTAIVLMLPVTVVFWMMDVIGTDMMIILIITALLGMALYSRFTVGGWDPLAGRDAWGRRR